MLHRWRQSFGMVPATRLRFSWEPKAAVVRRPDRRVERKVGQQTQEIDFLRVFAAHCGAADAVGSDWKSAVCQKVKEQMKSHRVMTVDGRTRQAGAPLSFRISRRRVRPGSIATADRQASRKEQSAPADNEPPAVADRSCNASKLHVTTRSNCRPAPIWVSCRSLAAYIAAY